MEASRHRRWGRYVGAGALGLGGLTGGLLDAITAARGGGADAAELSAVATPLAPDLAGVAWLGVVVLLVAAVWLHLCRRLFSAGGAARRPRAIPAGDVEAARLALVQAARGTVADRMFFAGLLMYAVGLAVYMLGRGVVGWL